VPTVVFCTNTGRQLPEYLVSSRIPFAYYSFDVFVAFYFFDFELMSIRDDKDFFGTYNAAAASGTVTYSATARVGKAAYFNGASSLSIPGLPDTYWQGTWTVV
jgi:hypothetical protein